MKRGVGRVVMQIGATGKYVPPGAEEDGRAGGFEAMDGKLKVEWFGLTQNFKEVVDEADLVITHAGAGSIFEALQAKKTVVAVTNPVLMDNHQAELAKELERRGHVRVADGPGSLAKALDALDSDKLKPYVPGDPAKVANAVNALMGFA